MDLINLMVIHEKLIVIFAALTLILDLRFHRNKAEIKALPPGKRV